MSDERRAAQRFEVFAQANVMSGGDTYLLKVRNISSSGAFLEGSPKEHPDLVPGVQIDVTLSATAPGISDEDVLNIQCRGRIERVSPAVPGRTGGFGVALEPATAFERKRLEGLLVHLAVPPPIHSSGMR